MVSNRARRCTVRCPESSIAADSAARHVIRFEADLGVSGVYSVYARCCGLYRHYVVTIVVGAQLYQLSLVDVFVLLHIMLS